MHTVRNLKTAKNDDEPAKAFNTTVSMHVKVKQTTTTCWRTSNRLKFENGEKRYNSKHVCLCKTIRIHRQRKMEIIYFALRKASTQIKKHVERKTKRNPHKKNIFRRK
jgi:hypothetical protein